MQQRPMRAGTPLAVPLLGADLAAVAELRERAPSFPNVCTCGEVVEPERLRDSWAFYCQSCGRDWTAPAPLERRPMPRRGKGKRCTCMHKCNFCGGARRR